MCRHQALASLRKLHVQLEEVNEIKQSIANDVDLVNVEFIRSSKALMYGKDMQGRITSLSLPYETFFGVKLSDQKGRSDVEIRGEAGRKSALKDKLVRSTLVSERFWEAWYNPAIGEHQKAVVVKHPWFTEAGLSGTYGIIAYETLHSITEKEFNQFTELGESS